MIGKHKNTNSKQDSNIFAFSHKISDIKKGHLEITKNVFNFHVPALAEGHTRPLVLSDQSNFLKGQMPEWRLHQIKAARALCLSSALVTVAITICAAWEMGCRCLLIEIGLFGRENWN